MKNPLCDTGEAQLGVRTEDKELARLAQAPGHPARVAVVRLLHERLAGSSRWKRCSLARFAGLR